MKLNELTIKQANQGLKNKEFSAVDLTKACLDQIEATDDKLNAFITVTKEQALAKAEAVDQVGDFSNPLSGIPAGIKDLFCTKDVKTTAASRILENYIPPHSSSAVKKLEDQNFIMVGKTNLDEFACGSSTETSYFGDTKNPWDLQRVPGGSSGGSVACVAADQSIYSLGTDTGGSIRQPAALTGVVGLKPTYGRVSRYGVVAMASSLDQVGPITKTVEDAALVLEQIAGPDKKDSTTVPIEVPKYSELIKQDIKGVKIGIPKEYFVEGMDPEVEKSTQAAIKKLEELGAEIQEVSLPTSPYGLAVYYIIMPSELSSNLARYDGIRYGTPEPAENLLEQYLNTRAKGFGDEVRRRIMLGTYSLSSGYYDAYYLKAQKVRTLIKNEFEKIFEQVDCIVSPTTPTAAFKLGEKIKDPLSMYLNDVLTVTANIAGIPAISVPCGLVKPKDGDKELPVGLQIMGKQFDESKIMQIAYNYQEATDWHKKKPNLDLL